MTLTTRKFLTAVSGVFILTAFTSQAWACHLCGAAACCVPCDTRVVEVEEEYVAKIPYAVDVERTIVTDVPYIKQVEQSCTVMVPHEEVRTGTKTVVKVIPVVKTITVSRDFGRWVTPEQPAVPACACRTVCCDPCCDPCCGECCVQACCECVPQPQPRCEPVWVPDVRTREIAITQYRHVTEEVPYECTVTVLRPEERTKTVSVVYYKQEERVQKMRATAYREEVRTRKVCVPQPTCDCCVPSCTGCH